MGLFSFLPSDALHVYLDESVLKIAKVKVVSGKKVITGLYQKHVLGVKPETLPGELLAGLEKLSAKPGPVNLVLSSKYVITKNIEVPSLDEKEIDDIVRLQAVRHTPYSKEEVIVGHLNLEVVLDRYTRSLLVIATEKNVRKSTLVVLQAGCSVSRVHLVSEILSKNLWQTLQGKKGGAAGYVYLDASSTELVVMKEGKPFYVRNIPIGAKHIKQEPLTTSKQLREELKKTCEAYQDEDFGPLPDSFTFLGTNGAERDALLLNFEEEVKIKLIDASSAQNLPLSPEAKKVYQAVEPVSFLDVALDGVSEETIAVDLMPEDLKIRKSFRNKGQEIFVLGTFIMVIFILTISIFLTKIYFRGNYLREIRSHFQEKKQEAEELVAISERTRIIKDFKKTKHRALKILNELQTILPEAMYLSEINLNKEERVTIQGTSDYMSLVFSFVKDFENSEYFQNVTADFTKSRKEKGKDVSDFGLSANLEAGSVAAAVPLPEPAAAEEALPAPPAESGTEPEEPV